MRGASVILVADDDDDVRDVVVGQLREAGYAVLSAATGDEALALADAAPDLLIADLVMPPSGGMELAERLRARLPGLAVLHISGYAPRPDFNSDATAVLLSKPFRPDDLLSHVEWLLAWTCRP
ncbi:MAG: response regulator [Acidobacteriota bacterium]|nr:response regulator [Acidobacteriota bacterium]